MERERQIEGGGQTYARTEREIDRGSERVVES